MTSHPNIHAFLDASTAHITRDDNVLLLCWSRQSSVVTSMRVIDHEYGWFVHVPLDDPENVFKGLREIGFSDAFIGLLSFAKQHGCWWVNLDRDADEIPGLATFDW